MASAVDNLVCSEGYDRAVVGNDDEVPATTIAGHGKADRPRIEVFYIRGVVSHLPSCRAFMKAGKEGAIVRSGYRCEPSATTCCLRVLEILQCY